MKMTKNSFLKVWHSVHWITWMCQIIEFLRIPKFIDFLHRQKLINAICKTIWRVIAKVEPLSDAEKGAAVAVFGPKAIQYDAVRVAQGRLLTFFFWINKNVAFTTLHSINLPQKGDHRRYLEDDMNKPNLNLIIHELTHVYQFERVGSVYMFQALRAQRETEASGKRYIKYNYGDEASDKQWKGLKEYRREGWKYKFYNREQQAQIVQDYYYLVIENELGSKDDAQDAYKPFIEELSNGEL
ncbi:hypothetical protein KAR91_14630 [Candidatus Pacearchaeota archaeon]|nr:hypothetical protein [Candidatus Pacearchaeota archaeon]